MTSANDETSLIKERFQVDGEAREEDSPFGIFSWQDWLEMQAHMMQNFTRFQRAVHDREAKVAIGIAHDVINMGLVWLEEVMDWVEKNP